MSSSGQEPDPQQGAAEAAAGWIARLTGGPITAADRQAFDAWLVADPQNRPAFERARAVYTELDRLPEARAARPRIPRASLVGAAIAAGIAVMVILAPVGADFRTAPGELRQFSLPDDTKVWLDSDSAFDLAYSGAGREVRLLHGRAFFVVAPNDKRPFAVRARDARITDIGTAFAVDVAEGLDVGVESGEVEVERRGRKVRLTAGRRGRFDRSEGGAHGLGRLGADDLAWRQGRIVLDRTPLRTALAELDRYRPGRILWLAGDAAMRPVSGVVLAATAEEGIDTLAKAEGLRLVRLPGLLLVMSELSPRKVTSAG